MKWVCTWVFLLHRIVKMGYVASQSLLIFVIKPGDLYKRTFKLTKVHYIRLSGFAMKLKIHITERCSVFWGVFLVVNWSAFFPQLQVKCLCVITRKQSWGNRSQAERQWCWAQGVMSLGSAPALARAVPGAPPWQLLRNQQGPVGGGVVQLCHRCHPWETWSCIHLESHNWVIYVQVFRKDSFLVRKYQFLYIFAEEYKVWILTKPHSHLMGEMPRCSF